MKREEQAVFEHEWFLIAWSGSSRDGYDECVDFRLASPGICYAFCTHEKSTNGHKNVWHTLADTSRQEMGLCFLPGQRRVLNDVTSQPEFPSQGRQEIAQRSPCSGVARRCS